jgi:glutathione peroxidase-family protein
MFSKVSTKGDDLHPLYAFLTASEKNTEFAGELKLNFQKYHIDKNRNIVGKYLSSAEPLSKSLTDTIEAALK